MPRLTPEILASFYEVIDYLWRDEQKDWEERGCPTTGHIFNHLRRIENWLAEDHDEDAD